MGCIWQATEIPSLGCWLLTGGEGIATAILQLVKDIQLKLANIQVLCANFMGISFKSGK